MSFFNQSEPVTGSIDNDIAPIPKGTEVLAFVEDGKIDEYQGEEKVKLTWVVLEPAEYKNRKVFQNIKVFDQDANKAEKAKKMLATIDFNAGGKLVASGQVPNDMLLMSSLSNKPMMLKLEVWGMNGNTGNWVSAVAPKGAPIAQAAPVSGADDGDDVPF